MVEEFKQTEVGAIPNDWDASDITKVINKSDGIKIGPFGSQLKKELLTNSGYKVYGQENVYEKNMEVGDRYISKEHFKKLNSCEIKEGDFLISMMGTIGKCMIVPKKFEAGIMDSHLIRLRLDKEKLNSELLLHFFSSKVLINQVKKFSVGGIMDGLSSKIVKQIYIPHPPTKPEQNAIANALNDADALISSLENLLVKKRNIKTGAMQELLKPKEDWVEKKLGEICKIVGRIGFRGYTVNDIVEEGNGAITISPSNIINQKIDFKKCTYISWFKYEQSPEIKIYNGDILLVKTGSTFGKTALVKNLPIKATINPQLVVLKKVIADNTFLSYILSSEVVQNQINNTIEGGAIPTLSQAKISSFKIPLPHHKTEQTRIAQILSDIDNEIAALVKTIAKYKMLKQGMMQNLLTGKIRLV